MSRLLTVLAAGDLRQLEAAVRSGRLAMPFQGMALQRYVAPVIAEPVAGELQELADTGFGNPELAALLGMLAARTEAQPRVADAVDLVISGPESDAVANRDTGVVVRELFSQAEKSVLVAGFAVRQGQRVFQALADRMEVVPHLDVQMFLDIQRAFGDTTVEADLVRRFRDQLVEHQWPVGRRLPRVFYFPASLRTELARRASLHAKCVVIDRKVAFVSSANFTEAAQQRNIEVGVLLRMPELAEQLTRHWEGLVDQKQVCALI